MVSAAKNTVTGAAGAAKFFIRTREIHPAIAREIAILKALPAHVRLYLPALNALIATAYTISYSRRFSDFATPSTSGKIHGLHALQMRRMNVIILRPDQRGLLSFTPHLRVPLLQNFSHLSQYV
jgi:hypothetical protein